MERLPIAPSLEPVLQEVRTPPVSTTLGARTLLICGLSVGLAGAAALVAQLLGLLIGLVTNLAFYGRLSTAFSSPAGNHLGPLVVVVPLIGGLVVGVMARYGSQAIRGHGIPEAMEQVLFNQSRIPPKVTLLKPLSAAVAIGTGGPFGAEGPIIATGGALGSLVGQLVTVAADERKTLLAAGAAAGMSATFGSPVSAVILAIELLLFEYRPRSIIPVALASATAAAARAAMVGTDPVFAMSAIRQPSPGAMLIYVLVGAAAGLVATFATRAVYAIEDGFEKLPVHWMWWPAIGALAVGGVGYFAPRTLGVGYDNIEALLSGHVVGAAAAALCVMKFVSWSIALGSGTSGGTLAPLLTIGSGFGSVAGMAAAAVLPGLGIDPRIAALVGMAAVFAGASRAVLASVVFAFETTRQPMGLLPLLGGCAASYLVSALLMRHSIMTEKIARRGARVPAEYQADFLGHVLVRDQASAPVVTLGADEPLAKVRVRVADGAAAWKHQGFPVLDERGELVGVLTRRDLFDPASPPDCLVRDLIRRPLAVVFEDSSLREAADHMVREGVGRLPVVRREAPRTVVGIITRSDLLAAHARRLENESPTPGDADAAASGRGLRAQSPAPGRAPG